MAKYEAVLFDLDGTLMETAYEIADAVNDTMEQYGFDKVDDELCKTWIGIGTFHLMACALAHVNGGDIDAIKEDKKTLEIYDFFKERYFERTATRSHTFDGAIEILQKLQDANIKTVVITNKEELFAQKLLDKHGLTPLLDLSIGGDTLETKKPNPHCIDYTMEKLGLKDKSKLLFIGDSKVDIQTAKNANISCYAVPYGYNGGEDVRDENPDKMIDSLLEIQEILN